MRVIITDAALWAACLAGSGLLAGAALLAMRFYDGRRTPDPPSFPSP